MLKKTKKWASYIGLGVVTTITVAVAAVVAYNVGYDDGHNDATNDWYILDS